METSFHEDMIQKERAILREMAVLRWMAAFLNALQLVSLCIML